MASGSDGGVTRRSLLASAVGLAAGAMIPAGRGGQAPEPVVRPLSGPSRVRFRKRVISEASDFEAASVADIDGDGKLDIVSGDTWYKAPDWTAHRFREIGVWGRGPDSSGYRADFADLPMDVNGDGRIDIVSSDYASGEIFWHENAGDSKDLWP